MAFRTGCSGTVRNRNFGGIAIRETRSPLICMTTVLLQRIKQAAIHQELSLYSGCPILVFQDTFYTAHRTGGNGSRIIAAMTRRRPGGLIPGTIIIFRTAAVTENSLRVCGENLSEVLFATATTTSGRIIATTTA